VCCVLELLCAPSALLLSIPARPVLTSVFRQPPRPDRCVVCCASSSVITSSPRAYKRALYINSALAPAAFCLLPDRQRAFSRLVVLSLPRDAALALPLPLHTSHNVRPSREEGLQGDCNVKSTCVLRVLMRETGLQPGVRRRRALQCDQGAGPGRIRHCLVGLADTAARRDADSVPTVRPPTTRPARV
jgi:hypothetical protein